MLKQLPKSWLSRPAAYLALGVFALLLVLGLVLPTCGTRPTGILTKRQQRAAQAQQGKDLAEARRDSAKAAHYYYAGRLLRTAARRYEDSATYYATHAQTITSAAADSSSLAQFWADFFDR